MAIEVKITNLQKVFWPEEGYTKGDLIDYYKKVSKWIFPYLKDRPESLHRFPNGIKGQKFYQKNVDHQPPEWVKTEMIVSESRGPINYLVVENIETIIYLANLGCIEMNPWSSRIGNLENPDWAVIDLDPEGISFSAVIEAAQAVHRILDDLKVPNYCKTSGATGLHIFIPLAAKYSYEQAKNFAHIIAANVHKELPKTTSLERLPEKRQGRVYLDFLQNNIGQTLAAPYSVRPRPGAPVSTPLFWKEVKEGLNPLDYNLKTIISRLNQTGDIFLPVLKGKTDILRALEEMAKKE